MLTHPTRVIEHAVKGMLPHNRLGAKMIKKLRVYAGDAHPHLAQVKASPVQGEEEA
jgi:large subunit ribosomal protein L13